MKPANSYILTINDGSSSIKFALYQAREPLKRCDELGFLGIELNESRNAQTAGVISMDASRATVRVIRTDEDLMIARSVSRILEAGATKGLDYEKPHIG